ncbi:exopolysaccharide biosynthesis polyprenyl glycosylphosphotransferase [Cetobacterium somerae ATCC BAA-474]|uniref:Exopolysaccharide biosynthesis polyprenyl glycosylphosphotransferase n=2 Tax=Cetobacterium TaxID=180162 RepID=U7V4Q5_9FUSO|nr:exopolysaccharide biosynthesis polyprenyl glycosylphosphotransferase [Cetobacterium somerae ATCC BAA-474]
MERHKRYIVGGFMILLQYLMFRALCMYLDIPVNMRNVSFFLYVFLYLKEDIYSFKTCLIWEELKKQLKCYGEYLVIISIIVYHTDGLGELWKYCLLGTIAIAYSFIVAKLIRLIFVNYLRKNVVIVGVGSVAKELSEVISQNRFTMYNFLGFIDIGKNKTNKVSVDKILGSKDILIEEVNKKNVQEIIIAIPNISDSDVNSILDNVYSKVKRIKIIPKVNRSFTVTPEIQDYDSIMLISSKNLNLSKKRKFIKRVLDIVVGFIGCLSLIPLTILVWIKTEKNERKNGIFFTQDRIGLDGKKIKIYKYRSMITGADDILKKLLEENPELKEEYKKHKKLKDDPRITKIGVFLRKTSLDEFPQFINVLKGEMSFVGPRPYLFNEIDDMGNAYDKIIKLKPGITGMWQAHGRSETDFNERLVLDEYYYRNWSLWLDIIIIIKTIKNVAAREGAY